MKTPLRTFWQWKGGEPCLNKHDEPRCTMLEQTTRWKRKNRVAQLKHTIAILTERLKDTEKTLIETQEATKCFFFRPDHWHPQGPDGKQYTRKQWRQAMKARKTKSPLP